MEVIAVDLGDVGIGDYDEWEVSKRLNSVRESNWEEVESEVCRSEESCFGERGTTISGSISKPTDII